MPERVPEERDPEKDELIGLMGSYQAGGAGGLEAFESLYAALAPVLARYFQSRTAQSAEDLIQETFLELHRSRHTYTPPLPVLPWVFGVARNVERRHWRRRRRHEAKVVELAGNQAAAPSRARWSELEDLVRRLPPSGRDAWLLHHVQGFSFSEIGARLRIESGAARLRAHRAMVALRDLLSIRRGDRHE